MSCTGPTGPTGPIGHSDFVHPKVPGSSLYIANPWLCRNVTYMNFNYKEALGDTIMEKYESLYCEVLRVLGELDKPFKTRSRAILVVSKFIYSIFEAMARGEDGQYLNGNLTKRVNGRWLIVLDESYHDDVLHIYKQ